MKSNYQEKMIQYIKNGGSLEYVPKEFFTQEMCDEYMKNGGSLKDVPEKFITQKMCDEYIKNGGSLVFIPEKFITQEMCDEYIKNERSLGDVPEKFITQEMCDEYIKNGGLLWFVPVKFRTQEMYKNYVKNGGTLGDVPEKFITQEMCNVYFEKGRHKNIDEIPEKFITQEMCEKHLVANRFNEAKSSIRVGFDKIPMRFRNKNICEKYIQMGGTIVNIPNELLTEEMCNIYIKNGGSINCVPEKYRTKEMWDEWYEENKEKQIIKDLLVGDLEFKTRKELENKYNITGARLNLVLEGIKQVKPEVYKEIKNKFKQNSLKRYYGIESDIQLVMNIIDSIGSKPQRVQRKSNTAYSKEQKVQFSYLLSQAKIHHSIFELYNYATSGSLKFDCSDFIRFCKIDLGLNFTNINKQVKNHWLMGFNADAYFRDGRGNEIKHVYLDKNGDQVEIKEPDLKIVLDSLQSNSIPKSNCIVNEAIRKYVQGELDIFINDLISGEYLNRNYKSNLSNNRKY